jgi:hypothetical protein
MVALVALMVSMAFLKCFVQKDSCDGLKPNFLGGGHIACTASAVGMICLTTESENLPNMGLLKLQARLIDLVV